MMTATRTAIRRWRSQRRVTRTPFGTSEVHTAARSLLAAGVASTALLVPVGPAAASALEDQVWIPGTTDPVVWRSVATGVLRSAAVTSTDDLYVWGMSTVGALGSGPDVDLLTEPTRIADDREWLEVHGLSHSILALTTDRQLFAWGGNDFGQLGVGDTVQREEPTPVGEGTAIEDLRWKAVSLELTHALGITTDGELYSWGSEMSGQAGHGTGHDVLVPTRVMPGNDWASVTTSENASFALTEDGELYVWGHNAFGQLGVGATMFDGWTVSVTPNQIDTPTAHPAGVRFSEVRSTYGHTLARDTDGDVWSWGMNSSGQLGRGSVHHLDSVPAPIDGERRSFFALGASSAVADEDRTWVWGSNDQGQLGTGTIGFAHSLATPTAHPTLPAVVEMTGAGNLAAIDRSGHLWLWGWTMAGSIGLGTDVPTEPDPFTPDLGLVLVPQRLQPLRSQTVHVDVDLSAAATHPAHPGDEQLRAQATEVDTGARVDLSAVRSSSGMAVLATARGACGFDGAVLVTTGAGRCEVELTQPGSPLFAAASTHFALTVTAPSGPSTDDAAAPDPAPSDPDRGRDDGTGSHLPPASGAAVRGTDPRAARAAALALTG